MHFLDIDKLLDLDAESVKDTAFKDTIGFGVPEGTSSEDKFLACHRFRDTYKQPAIFDISNSRAPTDEIYVPDKAKWNLSQTYAIEQLKSKFAYVVVSDAEAFELRLATLNALSYGDAITEVLRSKLLAYWREHTTREDSLYAPPEIHDAAYCAVQKTTSYFFRHIL